jgi:hypothetical protein
MSIFAILQSWVALITYSIFIDSIEASGYPAATVSPTLQKTFTTVPGIGLFTFSLIAPGPSEVSLIKTVFLTLYARGDPS